MHFAPRTPPLAILRRMTQNPSTEHFADRILAAARAKESAICVGLDPVLERLPQQVRGSADGSNAAAAARAIFDFSRDVIDAVADHAVCVKIQAACFERYLWPGVEAYYRVIAYARKRDLLVIGDAKRGDIGTSSAHYAAGNLADTHYRDLGDLPGPDALTVNSYLGGDGLQPFLDTAKAQGKGLFALVRTSNPGGDALQRLQLADGRTVAAAVAQIIAELGDQYVGMSGYSLLGAVVGATKPEDAAQLRSLMPRQIFLVPGFGAQGGGADDVRACFNADGQGAIITASRSILYAWEKSGGDWLKAVEAAAIDMKQQIAAIVG